jgi:hypothetical protein
LSASKDLKIPLSCGRGASEAFISQGGYPNLFVTTRSGVRLFSDAITEQKAQVMRLFARIDSIADHVQPVLNRSGSIQTSFAIYVINFPGIHCLALRCVLVLRFAFPWPISLEA